MTWSVVEIARGSPFPKKTVVSTVPLDPIETSGFFIFFGVWLYFCVLVVFSVLGSRGVVFFLKFEMWDLV